MFWFAMIIFKNMLFLHIQFKNRQLGQNDEIVKIKNIEKYVLFSPGSILSNPSVPSSTLFIKVRSNTSLVFRAREIKE